MVPMALLPFFHGEVEQPSEQVARLIAAAIRPFIYIEVGRTASWHATYQ